ncbi:hypothetical protein [Candidatus Venteria ishoeyi]|uniref:PEGA domain protein n=1 Tax=Candidatus Venteria ishoeyi TaxID=1899563 RepID=A0A1H6FFR7_9GAMM|nr:hypothetical protein [Candidatus Venteria ishoeyi]MDM8546440.1 hypothetical protein [Candidatus Venteria ishoeyi]SEH08493.1 PEGA domain protein [Candidatus Venteria ishoeyi]
MSDFFKFTFSIKAITSFLLCFIFLMPNMAQAAKRYKLYIDATPQNAKIVIWNIKPAFRQGIRLRSGSYNVQVSHPGYQSRRFTVKMKNKNRRLKVKLQANKRRLYIETIPKKANITIWNIKPKFQQGMYLASGDYDVEITHKGYESWRDNITLQTKDRHISIELEEQFKFSTQSLEPLRRPVKLATPLQTPVSDAFSSEPHYHLQIRTQPETAKVRLVNIAKNYQPNMLLPTGKYQLKVSAPGHISRMQWVEISDQSLALDIRLSTPEQCYYSEQPAHKNSQRAQLSQQVNLRFYGQYVEAIYTAQILPDRHINRFRLLGTQHDGVLDLIGTVYDDNEPSELRSQMRLSGNQLYIHFDGKEQVLYKAKCP